MTIDIYRLMSVGDEYRGLPPAIPSYFKPKGEIFQLTGTSVGATHQVWNSATLESRPTTV